jgi:hypothetical protein
MTALATKVWTGVLALTIAPSLALADLWKDESRRGKGRYPPGWAQRHWEPPPGFYWRYQGPRHEPVPPPHYPPPWYRDRDDDDDWREDYREWLKERREREREAYQEWRERMKDLRERERERFERWRDRWDDDDDDD